MANVAKDCSWHIHQKQQKKTIRISDKSEDESRNFSIVKIIHSTNHKEEMLFQIGGEKILKNWAFGSNSTKL